MNKVKYRVVKGEDEIAIILEDGGIATVREADESSPGDGRLSTTDYYQSRFTQEDLESKEGVWERVGLGKMYYEDWTTPFDDPAHIQDALNWLSVDSEFEVDESIWPSFGANGANINVVEEEKKDNLQQQRWAWKMKWCKDQGYAPANEIFWNMAEEAYSKSAINENIFKKFLSVFSEQQNLTETQVGMNKIFYEHTSSSELDNFLTSMCGYGRDKIQDMINEDGGNYSFPQKVYELMENSKASTERVGELIRKYSYENNALGKEILVCFAGGKEDLDALIHEAVSEVRNNDPIPSALSEETSEGIDSSIVKP